MPASENPWHCFNRRSFLRNAFSNVLYFWANAHDDVGHGGSPDLNAPLYPIPDGTVMLNREAMFEIMGGYQFFEATIIMNNVPVGHGRGRFGMSEAHGNIRKTVATVKPISYPIPEVDVKDNCERKVADPVTIYLLRESGKVECYGLNEISNQFIKYVKLDNIAQGVVQLSPDIVIDVESSMYVLSGATHFYLKEIGTFQNYETNRDQGMLYTLVPVRAEDQMYVFHGAFAVSTLNKHIKTDYEQDLVLDLEDWLDDLADTQYTTREEHAPQPVYGVILMDPIVMEDNPRAVLALRLTIHGTVSEWMDTYEHMPSILYAIIRRTQQVGHGMLAYVYNKEIERAVPLTMYASLLNPYSLPANQFFIIVECQDEYVRSVLRERFKEPRSVPIHNKWL